MGSPVRYAETGSFMGVPFSRDLRGSRAAVLGIPFDCGFHPMRIGARLGPQSIREHSGLVRRYEPPLHDFDPVARLGLVDCGDVRLRSSYIAEAFESIEAAVAETAFLAGTVMHKCLQLACAGLERARSNQFPG